MVWIPPGTFLMGCEQFYPEERPLREAHVEGVWFDRHPVTVREFRGFIAATGYETVAERPLDTERYPGADPELLVPGSLVFQKPARRVRLSDVRAWWAYVPGASWQHPEGPGSSVSERRRHPVVHVAYEDAAAYAEWAGKSLPTEAEWEHAARGGLDGKLFTWGDDPLPGGRLMANTWQGEFPWQNLKANGYEGTSPVGAFPPNGYGLYDMAGNVWEWTADRFATPARSLDTEARCDGETRCHDGQGQVRDRHCDDEEHAAEAVPASCCAPPSHAAAIQQAEETEETASPDSIPTRVIKGGSHLCAPNYCLRYRPAAREAEAIDTSTSHIGFRCVKR
jgi:formylglycine-generating enzyme required for sulfatase activity